MAYTQPVCLVIPAGVKQNGADCFAIIDPDSGGASTFSVALSASGAEPATYWGCRTPLEQATYDALTTMTTTQFKDYVNSLGNTRGRGQVSGASFKNSLQMSAPGADFWAYVTGLGLKPVQVAI